MVDVTAPRLPLLRPLPIARALALTLAPLVLALALPLAACSRPAAPSAVVDESGRHELTGDPVADAGGRKLEALLDGRVRLVGVSAPATAKPGERVPVTLLFAVERDCSSTSPKVFVHAHAPSAELNQAGADHAPLGGKVAPTEWRPGDLLVDRFTLTVPADIAVDELIVSAGLYEGDRRWPVTPASAHDGKDRIEIARLRIEGAPPLLSRADVPRRQGALVVDGVASEPDWQRAPVLTLRAYDGRSRIERATTARMLWDPEALWLAFEVADPDVFTVYTKRDDPLYESEATELFVDADGDGDVYVELQAAADDVHFDAAFAGGRRKGMDRSWDAPFETKSVRNERGFTSEWRVPVAALRDIPAGEPRAGAVWRVNLFRLERVRDAARSRVVRTEASAWSPPLSGDFHNLARFGTVAFVE